MLAQFDSWAALKKFHSVGRANKAVKENCYDDGLMLHHLPYIDVDGDVNGSEPFKHMETGDPLEKELFKAFLVGLPNLEQGLVYLQANLNAKNPKFIKHKNSGIDGNMARAACGACTLPNTLGGSVVIR